MTTVLLAPLLFRPFCRPASFPPVSVSHYAILRLVIVVVVVDVYFSVFLLFPSSWLFCFTSLSLNVVGFISCVADNMWLSIEHVVSNMLPRTCCTKFVASNMGLNMLTLNC